MDDQIGVVPCPVCAIVPEERTGGASSPPAKTAPPDPVAGLPADVSELEARDASGRLRSQLAEPRSRLANRAWVAAAVAFAIGIAVGAGSLLAWQATRPVAQSQPRPEPGPVEVAQAARLVEVAPMPREPRAAEPASEPKPEPLPETKPEPKPEPKADAKAEPKVAPQAPPLARVVVLDINQPDATYTVPSTARRKEHVILRGKVRMLRLNGLSQGAVLDASGLEVGSIYVSGKIDGESVLKLNAPDSVIAFAAGVTGKSRVEIHAPGGEVRFTQATTEKKPGSSIDGGSVVTITARGVYLHGDVGDADTKVNVTLTRRGSLWVAAVRGTAAVLYKADDPKAPEPTAKAEIVAPTATFKKVD
jgi:hypothetical protein